jgi:hypothetical protein
VPLPKVYDLFQDHDPDGAAAILMDHGGTRIDHIPGGLSEKQQYVQSLPMSILLTSLQGVIL